MEERFSACRTYIVCEEIKIRQKGPGNNGSVYRKEMEHMRKKLMALAMTGAMLAAATGCSNGITAQGETQSTEVGIINNTTPTNPGPGATLEAFPEEETEGEESRYVDENPVQKYGTIVSVDEEAGQITILPADQAVEGASQEETAMMEIVLNVADGVPILDAVSGMPVQMKDLQEGQNMYAWIGQAMTMSIPPQSALQVMVVNIPQDAAAPQYVVIKEVSSDGAGNYTFVDQNGARWNASEESTSITPYLTRQLIRLEGIEAGDKCMIWPGAAVGASMPPVYTAEKMMVFNW